MFQPATNRSPFFVRHLVAWLVFGLVLVLLLPAPVGAQASGVTLEATALYGGSSKYGEWLPVAVTLQNDGNDISGLVKANVGGSGGTTTYAQRMELPRGARKQVTLYVVPNNFTRILQVEFVTEAEDRVIASQEVDVEPVPNIRFIAATVTAGGSGLQSLADVNFRGEQQHDRALLVPLTLETLPTRPEGLRSLDLIVFSGVDTTDLSPDQQAALEQYVSLGGIVALGGGPEASRVLAGMPKGLVPVTLTGETELESLPALEAFTGEPVRVLGPYPAAVGEAVTGATVQLSQEGASGQENLPLVVEKEVGEGAVLWTALDPALSPFDAWAGTAGFWKAVVGERAHYPHDLPPDVSPRHMGNDQLRHALENLPSLDLPSLNLLVPLLAAYILIVGPVNYFALRRLRRLELAWVTIPLTTIIFSVGAYGLGFQLRGSDVIVNQVSIVQAATGSESAYVRSMVGVFSPSRRSYDLAIAGEPLLSTAGSSRQFETNSGGGEASLVLQGEPALVEDLAVNQWAMGSVMAETIVNSGYGVEAAITNSNGRLEGTITNRSDYPWTDVVVVHGGNFVSVGDIAPGDTQELALSLDVARQFDQADLAWRIFEENHLDRGEERERRVRQQIVRSQFYEPSRGGQRDMGPQPVMLAWIDQPPVEVELGQHSRPSYVATTLLTAELPIEFVAGQVVLTGSMLRSRIVRNDGDVCGMPGSQLAPNFNEAEIHFQVPSAARGMVPEEMAVHVILDHGWPVLPEMALYDHENDSWAMIDEPVRGRNIIQAPAPFLDKNGTIRLRVTNDGNERNGCIGFDVTLQGQIEEKPASAAEQS